VQARGNQTIAVEPTGVPMDTTKQQTSPWIPLDYMSDRAENDSFVSQLSFIVHHSEFGIRKPEVSGS
jgi:hypothetical protein